MKKLCRDCKYLRIGFKNKPCSECISAGARINWEEKLK